jgi:mannose-1-phosphate guanylyltransferase / mannose-6-phosphate isomerase
MNIVPIVLCGGSGTRLWPYSREQYPKQFLPLTDDNTLFENTLIRTSKILHSDFQTKSHIVVTNEEHRFLAKEQAEKFKYYPTIMLEPAAKNTAPALTIAALEAIEMYENAILVVSPADHHIEDEHNFMLAINQAIDSAANNNIVVLGINPDSPETGYGYIKTKKGSSHLNCYNVDDFVEKPDFKTAQDYIKNGQYFWNSGMFVLDARLWLKAIQELDKSIYDSSIESWNRRKVDGAFVRPDKDLFCRAPENSIDYSVMEKSISAGYVLKMISLNVGWDDLGSWNSIKKYLNKDSDNNFFNSNSVMVDSKNNLVHSTSGRLVTTLGIRDLCLIDTPDALLVASNEKSQDVKKIVNTLKSKNKQEATINRKTFRPWGWYDNIEEGEGFKVKRIGVNPGAVLSLQMHHKRSEHWVVIKGTAEVTCGENVFNLLENESTFIPIGQKHRLRNSTQDTLEIIEVQLGSYLEEDDIVRFEDTYGRVSAE